MTKPIFADMHLHALYGVDDGAKNEEMMYAMVEAAWKDGSRLLCLTPHFHPGFFGDNRESSAAAFEKLRCYAAEHFPDLKLILANELRYSRGCEDWLARGLCRTFGNTDCLLVDFSESERTSVIEAGLDRLLNAGYIPILAHVERYRDLWGKEKLIRTFRDRGVYIQVDTQSVLGDFGFRTKLAAGRLLADRLVDFIGSDAHDLRHRPPGIQAAYNVIAKKHGPEYAEAVCGRNAMALLRTVSSN